MIHQRQSQSVHEQNDTAHRRGREDGPEDHLAPLAGGASDPVNVTAFLHKADEASKARVVTQLQRQHGNAYVQRLLIQKESSPIGMPEWSSLVSAASTGTTTAINRWMLSATLTDVFVDGPRAQGGILRGAPVAPAIVQQMTTAGAPARVAHAFANAVGAAWSNWTAAVNVPGLLWYPAFEAFPGPQAPPTPNVPTPLVTMAPLAQGFVMPAAITAAIRGAMGEEAAESGGAAAAGVFAHWFHLQFIAWLMRTQVQMVLGSGPVPAFNPPMVPAGPVMAGRAKGLPGFLNSTFG